MNLQHSLLLAIMAGLHLTTADPLAAMARVTAGPHLPLLLPRQDDDICPPGDYTACADGNGCCESGAPCTTIRGEPACDSPCNGFSCGDVGLCCEYSYSCSTTGSGGMCIYTGDGLSYSTPVVSTDDDLGMPTIPSLDSSPTATGDDDGFPTIPDLDSITPTATPGPDETTSGDDFPTIPITATFPSSLPPLPTLPDVPTFGDSPTVGSPVSGDTPQDIGAALEVDVRVWGMLVVGVVGGLAVLL